MNGVGGAVHVGDPATPDPSVIGQIWIRLLAVTWLEFTVYVVVVVGTTTTPLVKLPHTAGEVVFTLQFGKFNLNVLSPLDEIRVDPAWFCRGTFELHSPAMLSITVPPGTVMFGVLQFAPLL